MMGYIVDDKPDGKFKRFNESEAISYTEFSESISAISLLNFRATENAVPPLRTTPGSSGVGELTNSMSVPTIQT